MSLLEFFFQRQASQSSALGALMSFSVKLSDMERQITSFERKIQRQTAEIDQLSAKLDSKAERSQFQNLETLLNSKMVTLKDEINTKDLVVERYRNKLRQLEAEVTVSGLVYDVPSKSSLVVVLSICLGLLCIPEGMGWGGVGVTQRHRMQFWARQVSKRTSNGENILPLNGGIK